MANGPEILSRIFCSMVKDVAWWDGDSKSRAACLLVVVVQTHKSPRERAFMIQKLAEWTGLEPATPGVTGRYSNQLNYHSAWPASPGSCDPQALPKLGVP